MPNNAQTARLHKANEFVAQLLNTNLSMPFENALTEILDTLDLWSCFTLLTGYKGGDYTGYEVFLDGMLDDELYVIRKLCRACDRRVYAHTAEGAAIIPVVEREFFALRAIQYLRMIGDLED